jgi:hypothetical protein
MKRLSQGVSTLLALACLLTAAPAAPAQQERLPIEEGTHLFRRVLHDLGLEPLENLEQLTDAPENKLLIILGETDVLDRLPEPLEEFVNRGGALLLATDRETVTPALRPFGVSVAGSLVSINPLSKFAYLGAKDCIIIQGQDAGVPFFEGGLNRVATNRPGYLRKRTRELQTLAKFPDEAFVPGNLARVPLLFAIGGDWNQGRVLFLSDHSVFINAMLWQPDNQNLDFTYNCVAWLSQGKRTQVLFVEEGNIQKQFDIPLQEAPPPPLPAPETIVQAVNEAMYGMEQENRFNQFIYTAFSRINPDQVLKGLIIVATLGLAVYGLARLGQLKHHWEPGTPLFEAGLIQLVPSVHVLAQRHRAMMREGNFWEAGQALTRQAFASVLGPEAFADERPPLQTSGSWRQRLRLRRRVKRLWRLATGSKPRPISTAQLAYLREEVAALNAALADGSLRLEREAGERPKALRAQEIGRQGMKCQRQTGE